MKDEYRHHLEDIVEAMKRAESFIAGMDYETFAQDTKTVYAVIRALEIIGEACKRVPDKVRDQYPNLPWRAMAGMRDRLIHAYNNVNLKLVWETVFEQNPTYRLVFERILKDIAGESEQHLNSNKA